MMPPTLNHTPTSRDARQTVWARLGMTACFAVAAIMLVSGLGGPPLDAAAAHNIVATIQTPR